MKVLLNRKQHMTQKCSVAAKNNKWGLGLLERESGPWKEEGNGGPISSVPLQEFWVYFQTYILDKDLENLGLVQQQVTRMGRERGTSNPIWWGTIKEIRETCRRKLQGSWPLTDYVKGFPGGEGIDLPCVTPEGRPGGERWKTIGQHTGLMEELSDTLDCPSMAWGALVGSELSVTGGVQAEAIWGLEEPTEVIWMSGWRWN